MYHSVPIHISSLKQNAPHDSTESYYSEFRKQNTKPMKIFRSRLSLVPLRIFRKNYACRTHKRFYKKFGPSKKYERRIQEGVALVAYSGQNIHTRILRQGLPRKSRY